MENPQKTPWHVADYGREVYQRYAVMDGPTLIAKAFKTGDTLNDKARENAMLMAAAPDMLEALQDLMVSFKSIGNIDVFPSFHKAMAAVNKATGNALIDNALNEYQMGILSQFTALKGLVEDAAEQEGFEQCNEALDKMEDLIKEALGVL